MIGIKKKIQKVKQKVHSKLVDENRKEKVS